MNGFEEIFEAKVFGSGSKEDGGAGAEEDFFFKKHKNEMIGKNY